MLDFETRGLIIVIYLSKFKTFCQVFEIIIKPEQSKPFARECPHGSILGRFLIR